ncbi:MAG: hypothetical protein PWP03_431 [Candidatus Woesearchaeota archaeon]|nr:hypothetical protein [Candidatus Woesearchaeota archaeon]MDN5327793.1 hypothetical protein [Candidatus Woesearchaeota archaeon]
MKEIAIIKMANENFESNEEYTAEDLLYDAHLKIDALIELLIDKGVITEEEFNNKLDELVEEDLEDEEEQEE